MRNWIAAAGILCIGLSGCNTLENIVENMQVPEKPVLTLADVVPVMQPRTPAEKAKQDQLLQEDTTRFKSRKLASEYYVTQARRTFEEQKTDSAQWLLGRAWLMDSTNNDVYQAYGRIYGEQKQYDKALFILYHALEADPQNPQLLTDIATSYLGRFYATSNPDDLRQSRKLLEQALVLSPDEADINYKLAINSYYMQEYGKAWDYLHKSLRQDKEIAGKSFISALLEKQQDPMGIYNNANVQ
ncbi:hypothetical protein I2I11_20025 [Pontibacter sp. 172403-2]|uniref:tetratricopeptide repeat protein n=1 Tax=Pontibacter rufus TaxID=2791028 RepID=UPI0018AF8B22|nr:tetratricopeptide repeat protein [Pontibacter sp. 172403-2]MBF9255597.1 hypothetical protein [Pontibacter sp. 172403-2]